MKSCTERDTLIYNLYFNQHYTIKEVAEFVGIPSSSVFNIVERLKKNDRRFIA